MDWLDSWHENKQEFWYRQWLVHATSFKPAKHTLWARKSGQIALQSPLQSRHWILKRDRFSPPTLQVCVTNTRSLFQRNCLHYNLLYPECLVWCSQRTETQFRCFWICVASKFNVPNFDNWSISRSFLRHTSESGKIEENVNDADIFA